MFNDYFNPNAAKPSGGWQPQGGLGGLMYNRDREQYDQLMGLQQQLMQDHLQRQQMETQTYGADAPVRESERPAKMSGFELQTMLNRAKSTPAYANSAAQGDIGRNQTAEAEGRIAQGTADSTIGVRNTENAVKIWDNAIQQIEYSRATSPIESQRHWDKVYKTLPAGVREHFDATYSPEQTERLKALRTAAINNIAEQRNEAKIEAQSKRDVVKEREMQKGRMDVQREASERAIEVAWIRFGMRKDDKEKIEGVLKSYLLKLSSGQPVTPQETQAAQMAERIIYQVHAAAQATIADPNAIAGKLLNIPQQARGTPESVIPNTPQAPQPPVGPQPEAQGGAPQIEMPVSQTEVENAWGKGSYDVKKWQYRRGPSGKLQRAPK